MPSATLQKVHQFVDDLGVKVHNLSSDTLKFALSDTGPTTSSTVYTTGSFPAPSANNGYTAGGHTLTKTYTETAGTGTLALSSNVVITATAGGIGPFRYVILYNDTPTSPADPIIGWFDYGSSITAASGETFTINSGTLLTVA